MKVYTSSLFKNIFLTSLLYLSVIYFSLSFPSSKFILRFVCASFADSIAIFTRFTVVNDKFPLPTEVFSPCLSVNTLVLHPIVAHS